MWGGFTQMLKAIFKGSMIIFMLGMILVSFALGFYFGYDWASDYCYDIIQDCVDKLQSTPLGIFVTEEYRINLTELLGEKYE